jgi:hypothetical protein
MTIGVSNPNIRLLPKYQLHTILELCYNRHMKRENINKKAVVKTLRRKCDTMQYHLDESDRFSGNPGQVTRGIQMKE